MLKSKDGNKVIGIVILIVSTFAMKLIDISDECAMVETQNEEYEEVRYFGTIKTISCTVVFDGFGSERVLQYLGYDTNTIIRVTGVLVRHLTLFRPRMVL